MKKAASLALFTAMLLSLCACGESSVFQDVSDLSIPEHVQIVALGEATHGNAEFNNLIREIFEPLIKQGYTALALEIDFASGALLNDYILNGVGTAEEGIATAGHRIFRNHELVDVIEWLREYNLGVSDEKKIYIYGYDMQFYSIKKLLFFRYIETVAPEKLPQYRTLLEPLNELDLPPGARAPKAAAEALDSIIEETKANEAEYVTLSSQAEYDYALRCIMLVNQYIEMNDVAATLGSVRDKHMAENTLWILERERQRCGGKLMIYSHVTHIKKELQSEISHNSMGRWLYEALADAYYAIGTDFAENTFVAYDVLDQGKIKEFSVVNDEGELIRSFIESGKQVALLDVSSAMKNEKYAGMLTAGQNMGYLALDTSQSFLKSSLNYTRSITPADNYDAIIFFRHATPKEIFILGGK